jgi:titin
VLAAPGTPSGLVATAVSASEIDLSWDAVADATAYALERSVDSVSGWSLIGTTSATTFQNLGLTAATAYFYRVTATNSVGSSAASNVASATTASLTIPNAPSNLSAVRSAKNKSKLTWTDNSSNEAGFILERSTATSGWATIATLAANTTSFVNNGLSRGVTYFYRISAYNGAGASTYATASMTAGDAVGSESAGAFSNGPSITDNSGDAPKDKDLLLA